MRRKIQTIIVLCFFFVFNACLGVPAYAADDYYPADEILADTTNGEFESNRLAAGYPNTPPPLSVDNGRYFTEIKLGGTLKPGDRVILVHQKWDGTEQEVTVTSLPHTCTTGLQYGFYYKLLTGSANGWRNVYFISASNIDGDTRYWTAPEPLPDDPKDPPEDPPEDPPYDPPTGTDLTEVIAGINEVKGAVNGMSSGVITELQGVRNQLASLTSDMNQQFDAVKSRLDTISSDVSAIRIDVADIKDDVSVIKSDVAAMKNYFTTPRSPSPFQVNTLPQPSMNSTVPDLTEPYQTPYTYDRSEPTLPPAAFGPEPLPFAPDPEVMPHDDPLLAQAPTMLDEPVTRENPRTKDPVMKEDPKPIDPVIKEEPRQRDPVKVDPPRSVEPPIGRQTPRQAENALIPQPPVNRTAPLTPEPPRTPGG